MTHDTPANDAISMWRSQEKEHPIMSAEEIRIRSEIIQTKIRRNLVVSFVFGLLCLALGALAVVHLRSTPARVATAAVMALTVTLAYTAYRRIWPLHTLSPNPALKDCLEFYRNELKAQYHSAELTLQFLAPIVVFVFLTWGLIIRTGPRVPRILLPSVLILILLVRRYEARRVKQKLAALEEFEKESS